MITASVRPVLSLEDQRAPGRLAAQEDVERQLRDPSAEWEPSTSGIIAEFAMTAGQNIGNPLWLRLTVPSCD